MRAIGYSELYIGPFPSSSAVFYFVFSKSLIGQVGALPVFFFSLHVFMCTTCVPGVLEGRKRVPDALNLEL